MIEKEKTVERDIIADPTIEEVEKTIKEKSPKKMELTWSSLNMEATN